MAQAPQASNLGATFQTSTAANSQRQNKRTARSAANPDFHDHMNDDFAGTLVFP